MDVIGDMGRRVFLKSRKQMGANFIVNRQLEMSEERHSESVEVMVGTSRQFDVPLCCSPCESSLKNSEMNGIINIRIGGALEVI